MSRRRPKPADPTGSAADRSLEDGTDPKQFRRAWDNPKQAGRKARQLCEQVRDALHAALAACGDPVLQALTVTAVDPAPHSGRLRVTLALPPDAGCDAATAAVARAAGRLRCEAAAAINRRYAPELVFEVT